MKTPNLTIVACVTHYSNAPSHAPPDKWILPFSDYHVRSEASERLFAQGVFWHSFGGKSAWRWDRVDDDEVDEYFEALVEWGDSRIDVDLVKLPSIFQGYLVYSATEMHLNWDQWPT